MLNQEAPPKKATNCAFEYALRTTNLQHAEALLSLAHQDNRDPKYISALQSHVAALTPKAY